MNEPLWRAGRYRLAVAVLVLAVVAGAFLTQRTESRAQADRTASPAAIVPVNSDRAFLRDEDYAVTDANGRSWIP